jgi:hypothetical protein
MQQQGQHEAAETCQYSGDRGGEHHPSTRTHRSAQAGHPLILPEPDHHSESSMVH